MTDGKRSTGPDVQALEPGCVELMLGRVHGWVIKGDSSS